MSWRAAHGASRDLGRLVAIETSPADELPAGLAAQSEPIDRRPDGRVTAAGARALGRRGGRRAAERRAFAARLADTLGLADVGAALAPHVEHAAGFAHAQLAHLAATVGGGHVGPGPASIVQSAALALAASRWCYALASRTGDAALLGQAARLADQSRSALLTAHELCAREARARVELEGDELARAQRAFQARLVGTQRPDEGDR